MSFVQTRTDQTKYSAVDGKVDAFGVAVEASAGGFGIKRTVKGVSTFEVLDALPLNRAAVQLAVEAGSARVAGTVGGAAAGFTAIDFATVDQLTAAEAAASATDAITPEDALAGDLT